MVIGGYFQSSNNLRNRDLIVIVLFRHLNFIFNGIRFHLCPQTLPSKVIYLPFSHYLLPSSLPPFLPFLNKPSTTVTECLYFFIPLATIRYGTFFGFEYCDSVL